MFKFLLTVFLFVIAINVVESNISCYKEYWKHLKLLHFSHKSSLYHTFMTNCQIINEHNSRVNKSDPDALVLGLNKFIFWSHKKFKENFPENHQQRPRISNLFQHNCKIKSKNVDWNSTGAVTPVKNQHFCESCYAFGTTAAIESAHFKATNELVSLSEQETIDCNHEVNGCRGGSPDKVLDYVKANGISLNIDYPYTARHGACSKLKNRTRKIKISNYCNVESNSLCLMEAIEKHGPIIVSIDTHCVAFQLYRSGIISCNFDALKFVHSSLAYGYHLDKDPEKSYYMLKNSWGTYWGNKGHFKITMRESYDLGITMHSMYVLVNGRNCY